MPKPSASQPLQRIYSQLLQIHGPQNWWPAKTPFEVVVGAILTQNTNWRNVEKAISNLEQAKALEPETIRTLAPPLLQQLIRPSGFFRQKAARLRRFCQHLQEKHQGSLQHMLRQPLAPLRQELLGLKGIGPETADSILLYAAEQPSFVVDAYTRRIFQRLGLLQGKESYTCIRALFMQQLAAEVKSYKEYHALIVVHAKAFCHKQPLCAPCPMLSQCPHGQQRENCE